MTYTIQQIAQSLGAEAVGDLSLTVAAAAEPADAGPGDLAMAMAPKYAEDLAKGSARAAMLWPGADWAAMGLKAAIFAPRPRMAMAGIARLMDKGQGYASGIHPSAVIDPSAELGADVLVGPLAVIGARARIGAGSVIGPQVFVGADVVIGENAFLREMVSIGSRSRIGARFIAQPGARVGGDGFSFVTPEVAAVENARKTLGDTGDAQKNQAWLRINSLGAVRIGDDVELGSNCTIDNGTVRDTVIGDGTKIDNLVQVGHNTRVGKNCLLCGLVGIAGSVDIGDNVVLGGQVGVKDNIFIGDNVLVGGGSKVLSNAPAGRVMMGYPAIKLESHTEIYKALRRLPRLASELAALQKAVFNKGSTD